MASFYTSFCYPHMLAEAGSLRPVSTRVGCSQHDLIYTEWIAETSWPEDLTHILFPGKQYLPGNISHLKLAI